MTVQENNEAADGGSANVPAASGGAQPVSDKLAEIQCPSCDARYRVPQAALGTSGRRVQCASCGEVWHATAAPPRPAQADASTPATDAGTAADAEATAQAAPADQAAPRQRRSWRDRVQAKAEADAAEEAAEEAAEQAARAAEAKSDSFAERLAKVRGTPATKEAAADTADENAEASAAKPAAPKRDEQMAEIRRMLDDLKTDEQPTGSGELGISIQAPPPTETVMKERDVAGIEKMAPAPEAPAAVGYSDPLREKLLDADTKVKRGADGEAQRAGLMRRHQKRTRRRRAAEETRRSRSGFYTGLVLVALVGMMLFGVYAYADKLSERMPEVAPALAEYKTTVDGAIAQGQGALSRVRERLDVVIKELFAE